MVTKKELKLKRHNAAVKAWETRRSQSKGNIRHMAAIKAWETRRSNN